MSHLSVVIKLTQRNGYWARKKFLLKKNFAIFRHQVSQITSVEDLDEIRVINNFDDFSELFESLLERVEGIL